MFSTATTVRPRSPAWAGSLLLLLLVAAGAGPARSAEERPAWPTAQAVSSASATAFAPPFAEGWSLKGLFSGMTSRTRVVQLCVVCMALGLFILLKKFAPADRPAARGQEAGVREAQERETQSKDRPLA